MSETIKVLLLTKTCDYRHDSIPATAKALSALPSLTLTHTEDDSLLEHLLPSQDILILGHNTGDFLGDAALHAVKRFVETDGKGVVGVHACTAGMLDCDWYGEMLGAKFDGHPDPQWGKLKVHYSSKDDNHPEHFILQGLPSPTSSSVPNSAPPCPTSIQESTDGGSEFAWYDEWYNFKSEPHFPPRDSKVLVSVDPTTYEGGPKPNADGEGKLHPLAWCHEVQSGGTRVFYTALGHFDEAYDDPWFMNMLERGIWWTARLGK